MTKNALAFKQEKVLKPKKHISYCILCGQIVNEQVHPVIYSMGNDIDWNWCDGVLTEEPPPPWPKYWEDFAIEPDEEFMDLIDENAPSL